MSDEFKSFTEIVRLSSQVTITEKIHGTNAQISISEDPVSPGHFIVRAGSRTRWITPEDDNYGFAAWVARNREALIGLLGPGRHFGEWYGAGINSGYGLKEKRFALFNPSFTGMSLPPGVDVVPVLYRGPWDQGMLNALLTLMKEQGSRIVPGFMHPEGVVIRFDRNGATFKQVFEVEETSWTGKKRDKDPSKMVASDAPEVLALLQPIRLEKLLSRDERYLREYPATLSSIARDYMTDLEKEQQLEGVAKEVQKRVSRRLFTWVKEALAEKGYVV